MKEERPQYRIDPDTPMSRSHGRCAFYVVDQDDCFIFAVSRFTESDALETANRIIKALNEHPALVEALEEIRDYSSCTQHQYEIIDRVLPPFK